MKITKEITPATLRCLEHGCPAVFETDQETYLVVGSVITAKEMPPELRNRIGVGETVIQVPKRLLKLV